MNKKSGSSLFLMEMLMVVMFFILCASTCILVFVKSNNLSRLAKDTNESVIVSESLAEFFKAGSMEQGMEQLNGSIAEDGSYVVQYDHNWETSADMTSGEYCAVVSVSEEGVLENAQISVVRTSDSKVLFELAVSRHKG